MSNAHDLLRSLLIYSICLPLAAYLGYSLATPDDFATQGFIGLLLFLLATPFLLRWHHALLLLCWNLNAVAFFLPGKLSLWMVVAVVSLCFSVLSAILKRQILFPRVTVVALPLMFLLLVILVTIRLTGGIGLQSLGSDLQGGKRFLILICSLLGFFALIARPVPEPYIKWYLALFFLPGIIAASVTFLAMLHPSFQILFLLFPPDEGTLLNLNNDVVIARFDNLSRLYGMALAGQAAIFFLLARHGIKELFQPVNWWKLLLCVALGAVSMLGGFRSVIMFIGLTFVILFMLEGLWRTRLLPILLMTCILATAMTIPLVHKLPLSMQRSLSFLPLDIDPIARIDAEQSTEWRLQMWRLLLPEVRTHLLVGKGYAINSRDVELAHIASGQGFNASEASILTGEYHNGPLSVILPLGIFGVIGFLWFLVTAFWVLRRNLLYGKPGLIHINQFLMAFLIAKTLFFFLIYGSLYAELFQFTGTVGLSICLNGGICRPMVTRPNIAFRKFRLIEATPDAANE